MAEATDGDTLPHLAIATEPGVGEERRRRRRPPPPPTPPRSPEGHASEVVNRLHTAEQQVLSNRRAQGIDYERLLVLEFQAWDPEVREVLETRFRISVLDEKQETSSVGEFSGDLTRVLVQATSVESMALLTGEATEYARSSDLTKELPPALRGRFFNALQTVRQVSRDERLGARLRQEGFPSDEPFPLDVDLWHPGPREDALEILRILDRLCSARQGRVAESMFTESLILARVKATRELAEALLELDLVAKVNLPPSLPAAYSLLVEDPHPLPNTKGPLGNEPEVGVIDSGVLPAHPLLRGWVSASWDFDSGEGTKFDQAGHGTGVAGLVVYGDVADCMESRDWTPKVMVANAKVLRKHPFQESQVVFPDDVRPEAAVERAIRTLHESRGCRIFNLSLGNAHDVYSGGRQFAWAQVLDELVRELDIVIVVAAGNRLADERIPSGVSTREALQEGIRDNLLQDSDQRLTNPATAALAITVGSIARSDRPFQKDAVAGAPKDAPSPFTRTGPGYEVKPTQVGVKPEFVAYGGNAPVVALGGRGRWRENDRHLGEPTLALGLETSRFLRTFSGTSFAAPHVSFSAAQALRGLEDVMEPVPANTIRAVLGATATTPGCGPEWLLDPEDRQTRERLRLVGYGVIDHLRAQASTRGDVLIVGSDSVDEDEWTMFTLPVPPSFVSGSGGRGITLAIAFDPPVRASRREYLARTMWLEVFKGLSKEEVAHHRRRTTKADRPPQLPSRYKLPMRPTRREVGWSTLQVQTKRWARRPSLPILDGAQEPVLHVLVGCQRRFEHDGPAAQDFGFAARFWHDGEEVDLYNELRARIRIPTSVRLRVERRG